VAAEEALKYYKLYDKVKSKLVYGENISQTNQFILTQAADAGFTAKSVILADEMKDKGTWVGVDTRAYNPIAQAAVILKHGAENNKAAAEKFYSFLFSKSATDILKQFGYLVN
jgi:molybdate transport system substrate-binding protein